MLLAARLISILGFVTVAFLFAAGRDLVATEVFLYFIPPIVRGWQIIPGYVEACDDWIIVGSLVDSFCALIGNPKPHEDD